MPNRRRTVSSTGVYHVFVRGINHELIFNQVREKRYFKKIIKKHLQEYEVEVYAYCIMSSHAHFIIKSENIQQMSFFMSKVLAEYAIYYNYKKNRNGHVFQNRFGSECIESTKYYWNCVKYIHLNPVKARMVSTPWEYQFSSMNDYKHRKEGILHKNAIQFYTEKFGNWEKFLEYHLTANAEIFIGTELEVYDQQKERAMEILRNFQKTNSLDSIREVLEDIELRKEYLEKMKEDMALSENLKRKIYCEIKKELIR